MTYVIAEPCIDVKDLSCIDECPVDCIYIGASMLYIHPDECVDCGACEPVCPVEAIYYEDDVPYQWADYTRANADFFAMLGSPGGARWIGPLSFDAPQVQPGGNPVVKIRASYERTTSDLLDLLKRGGPSGHALVAQSLPLEQALGAATHLLFDGGVSIGERSETSVAEVTLDSVLLPLGQVSVSRMIESAASIRSTGVLQRLPYVSLPKEIRQTVLDRASMECAGRPVEEVPYLYDKESIGLVTNLIPFLLWFAMRRGGAVHVVTESFKYASFIRAAMAGNHMEMTSAFDAEIVLPDLSRVPQPLLAAFRDSHKDNLTYHVNRMVELTNDNLMLNDAEVRRQHWIAARREIAEHGTKLRRLARTFFPGVRGDIALGIIGGHASQPSDAEPSIMEQLFTAAGLVLPQDDLVHLFVVTRLGRKGSEVSP
jgi:NAD-dependent dihydropyrimidine dehydrogenase PreA subunit